VLLVETAPFGLLPFFFGAHDQRYGHLRTFSPPSTSGDAPIQTVAFDPGALGPEIAAEETLDAGIARYSRGASRVIVDVATASATITRRIMKLNPRVLIPVIPDMNSVVSVSSIDAFFEQYAGTSSKMPYYVLNQFDPSLPLHLDVREVLREQLGDRLLTFALRRSPTVSEALAEGMTVMDYAPGSAVAEDFGNLAGWVKTVMAPASTSFRGVRWSEQ
jgi:cellulose synthase operon protein YhjQ